MNELPKKWCVVLTVASLAVPAFLVQRGISLGNKDMIVLAIWLVLLIGFVLVGVAPQFANDGTRMENRMSFLQACKTAEVWKNVSKQGVFLDVYWVVTCGLLLIWGLPWMGIPAIFGILLLEKIERARREVDAARERA